MDLTSEDRQRYQNVFDAPSDAYIQYLRPEEFARFIFYLFERDGLYRPVYVDGPGDGGVDIELRSISGAEPTVQGVAQCKRFTTHNVSGGDMTKFIEAARKVISARRYFFTSYGFAKPAIRQAREGEVMLFDPPAIRFWIQDIRRREALGRDPSRIFELPHPDAIPIPVISVSNNKGGVGKTTITGSLAAAFVSMGEGVLVIDADPQRDLSKWLTNRRTFDKEASLYAVLAQNHPIHPLICKTLEPGIWLLPACSELEDLPVGFDRFSLERRLAQAIAALPLADPPIRYIVIDTPPALSLPTRAALVAASHLLIPLELDLFSKEGIEELLSFVQRVETHHNKRPLRILGGVATMVDMRFGIGLGILSRLPKIVSGNPRLNLDQPVEAQFWVGRLRQRVDYKKALEQHKTVVTLSHGSDAARDILGLAKEVVRRVSDNTRNQQ